MRLVAAMGPGRWNISVAGIRATAPDDFTAIPMFIATMQSNPEIANGNDTHESQP